MIRLDAMLEELSKLVRKKLARRLPGGVQGLHAGSKASELASAREAVNRIEVLRSGLADCSVSRESARIEVCEILKNLLRGGFFEDEA
jgi:hypothetical protein